MEGGECWEDRTPPSRRLSLATQKHHAILGWAAYRRRLKRHRHSHPSSPLCKERSQDASPPCSVVAIEHKSLVESLRSQEQRRHERNRYSPSPIRQPVSTEQNPLCPIHAEEEAAPKSLPSILVKSVWNRTELGIGLLLSTAVVGVVVAHQRTALSGSTNSGLHGRFLPPSLPSPPPPLSHPHPTRSQTPLEPRPLILQSPPLTSEPQHRVRTSSTQ